MYRLLIAAALFAGCAARPSPQPSPQQVVFLVADAQGSLSPVTPSADQIASLLTNLQATSAAAPAAVAPAVAEVPAVVAKEAAVEVVAEEAAVEASPAEAIIAEAIPALDDAPLVGEVPVADPAGNLVDPAFQQFIFPDNAPAVVAAKQVHFAAVSEALGTPTGKALEEPTTAVENEIAPEVEAAPAEVAVEAKAAEVVEAEAAPVEAEAAEVVEAEVAEVAAEA